MAEIFYSIDKSVFIFINQSLANPVFDKFMPFLTDLNQHWYGIVFFGLAWLILMWKGGKKGRIIGLFLIPLVLVSDQLSSSVIKNIFERPRPCHEINGIPVIENIRLLVPCGSGFSFPSSHAANNFAVASLLSHYYRKYCWVFFSFATLVGISRISVGVHYPSDVIGGAVLGSLCTVIFIVIIWFFSKRLSIFDINRD